MGRSKKAAKKDLTVHVVSHTHWDREWYHPAAIFRQRLVPLIDNLLSAAREDPKLRFLLDGQAVVLEDYLAVRPDQREPLAKLLRSGAIEAGPWYVLADELIPAGEALVRNLLAGKRILQSLGARPSTVLYCPDSFGHPAALPALAKGFGCEVIVLWRGFGGASHPSSNCVRWFAPDGSSSIVYHLPRDGYELGAELPTAAPDAAARWGEIRAALAERDSLGVVLLHNGADHHALQLSVAEACKVLTQVARPDRVLRSSLAHFASDLLHQSAGQKLPAVRGELRDSYGYTWALQGTFASRSQLKRVVARAARILSREAEPWSAIAAARGAASRRHLLHTAWKPLLLSLPHDTICGCCIDDVASEALLRVRDAADQGTAIVRDSLQDFAGYDRVQVRRKPYDSGGDLVLVCNPAARERGGVAEVSLVQKRRDIRVGPGSALQPSKKFRAAVPKSLATSSGSQATLLPVQLLSTHSRYDLLESPHHYPDADVAMDRRLLVWMPPLPGYGFSTLVAGSRPGSNLEPANPARATERGIDNGIVAAGVTNDNRIWLSLASTASPRTADLRKRTARPLSSARNEAHAFVSIEDCYDAGDLYTPSLRHAAVVVHKVRSWRIDRSGPLRSSLVARFEWAPQVERKTGNANVISRSRRSSRSAAAPPDPQLRGWLQVAVTIDADRPFVRLAVMGDNRTKHHRLRLVISSDMAGSHTVADAAFAALPRAAIGASNGGLEMETPPATAPLHRFVTLLNSASGMTVYSDGCGEYESGEDGRVLFTIVRAVGELSRHDLPERPGHAGWPANTPLAQEQGRFECAFAWLPHAGGRWDDIAALVERGADDFLHPLRGVTLRSAPHNPGRHRGIELIGDGLSLSAIKESEDGESLVLRCVNLTGKRVTGAWVLGHHIRSARLASLDETSRARLGVTGGRRVPFAAAPFEIVTILVR